MLADADVLIRSDADPLLNIEFHRHFSHSLTFIPIGGLLAALLLFPLTRLWGKPTFAQIFKYSVIGYATAGLLDACTSYGTQLLWPFSDLRVSWSIISIVDPAFTLPLLILTGGAITKRKPQLAQVAASFAVIYLGIGSLQNHRAITMQKELATSRGHQVEQPNLRRTVKPSIANLFLWRSVYEYDGDFYVDAIRLGLFADSKIYPGSNLPVLDTAGLIAEIADEDPLKDDLERFDHFSEGYLARLPEEPEFITDLRYSALPNSINPLWGLNLAKINDFGHADFETRRGLSKDDREAFLSMLTGD